MEFNLESAFKLLFLLEINALMRSLIFLHLSALSIDTIKLRLDRPKLNSWNGGR